jgi:hypothetical protein
MEKQDLTLTAASGAKRPVMDMSAPGGRTEMATPMGSVLSFDPNRTYCR